VVPGGPRRQDSVYNGFKAVDHGTDLVMVHDGVRPFITPELVRELINTLDDCDGAILAVPAKDTLKEVTTGYIAKRTLDRGHCYMAQTPQVFTYRALKSAFDRACADGYLGTDEASLVEHDGGRVRVLTGSYVNIKITTPEDMILAEAILRKEAMENVSRERTA